MLHFMNWLIPNILYQADGGTGGEDIKPDPDPDPGEGDEDLEVDVETKLKDLDADALNELMDREDIDYDKYLDWMKTEDEEVSIKDILVEEETDDDNKDADDKSTTDDDDTKDKDADDDADLEKDKDPDKKTSDDDKSDDKKVDDDSKDKTDDDSAADDKTKAKTIKISDNYINKQVQSFRDQMKDDDPAIAAKKTQHFQEVMEGIKGGLFDPKSLKNYINAQMYIKTIKSPFDKDWKPEQKVVNDPAYIEKATKQKSEMMLKRLKGDYPDLPDDAFEDDDSLKDFEEGLSRREFLEFSDKMKAADTEITSEYDRYAHVVENWEQIATDTITTDVKLFEARIAKLNLSLKDLGIESLDLDKKDLYNEYLWKNVLFTDGKTDQPNDNVLTFMDGKIPIVKPGTVYQKLMDLNLEHIVGKKENDGLNKGFKAGINNQEDPSTSDLAGKKHREKVEIDEDVFDDDNLTPDQIQEKLDRMKSNIAAGGKKR